MQKLKPGPGTVMPSGELPEGVVTVTTEARLKPKPRNRREKRRMAKLGRR